MSISSDIIRIKGAKADLKTAINAKGGTLTTELIDEYPAAVDAISTGTDTSSATATANDILTGKTAYIADGTEATGILFINYYDFRLYALPILVFKSDYGKNYCVDGDKDPEGVFQGNTNVVDVTFILPSTANYFRRAFSGCANLEEVTVGPTSNVVNKIAYGGWNYGFNGCAKLHTIHSALNMSGATEYTGLFTGCAALSNITFDANSIIGSVSFNNSPLLSSASLLSIANGLDAASATKTLTMHATSKTNMDNIMVDVVDGVAVLGSTKTLSQFITTDKGWTIA